MPRLRTLLALQIFRLNDPDSRQPDRRDGMASSKPDRKTECKVIGFGSDLGLGAIGDIGDLDAQLPANRQPGGDAGGEILAMMPLHRDVNRGSPAPVIGAAER